MQERLDRLTKSVEYLNLEFVEGSYEEEKSEGNSECVLVNGRPTEDKFDSQSNLRNFLPENVEGDSNHPEKQMVNEELHTFKEGAHDDNIVPIPSKEESLSTNAEYSDLYEAALVTNKQSEDRRLPNAILPLLRHCQYESSESSCRYMTLCLSSAFSSYPYEANSSLINSVHCATTDFMDFFICNQIQEY